VGRCWNNGRLKRWYHGRKKFSPNSGGKVSTALGMGVGPKVGGEGGTSVGEGVGRELGAAIFMANSKLRSQHN